MKKLFLKLILVFFVIPFGMSQDLPSYVPSDGLVAYYPFNGNANDESGNGHHGTVNGATLSSDRDGNIDKAYEFSHDGASFGNNHQSIYIPFHSDFQSENFTVSIWFKADSYGWDGNTIIQSTLFSKRENSNQPNQATYRIQLSSDFIRSEIGAPYANNEPSCETNSIQPNLGAWYHAASTYDGTTLKQYINGVKVSEINCDLSHNAISTSGIMLGQTWQYNGYWYHLDGKLDEFMVYNRSMTEQEMENYYVSATSDILLNGTVSAENNQIKNVADPTDAQDAATKSYVDLLLIKINELQDQIDALQSASGSGTVTDQDGNNYPYLTYGDQVWTVKNAEIVTYRDGTPIPQVTNSGEWRNITTGAWCYYDNDPSKGKLYNWYAVAGIHDNDENTPNKEFAPEGWHVPSNAEWIMLKDYLIANVYNYDGSTTENKLAKAMASTSGWDVYNSINAGVPSNDQSLNNSSGFNAYPKGGLGDLGFSNDSNKPGDGSAGGLACFWSTTIWNAANGYNYFLGYNRPDLATGINPLWQGFSVRFVRD